MTCSEVQKRLSRDMDGELPITERARLERHMAGCANCRAALAAWHQARALLQADTCDVPPAEVMRADVLRAIRRARPEEATGGWPGWLRWAAVFSGLCLLGLGLWRMLPLRAGRAPDLAAGRYASVVESASAELPGASVMVYEDAASETVVIWLMVADNGAAEPKGT